MNCSIHLPKIKIELTNTKKKSKKEMKNNYMEKKVNQLEERTSVLNSKWISKVHMHTNSQWKQNKLKSKEKKQGYTYNREG